MLDWRVCCSHKRAAWVCWLLVLALGTFGGCAQDNRTGPALLQALVEGPLRTDAAQAAQAVSRAAQRMDVLTLGMIDQAGAQQAWRSARLSYDRAAAVFFVLSPALNSAIDGRFDDVLSSTGLRRMEPILFSPQPLQAAELRRHATAFRMAAEALPFAVMDTRLAVQGAEVLGSMAATAAVVATKLDGSDSPYAEMSHLSMQENLRGLQAQYHVMSALVAAARPGLDARILALFAQLLAQIEGVPSVAAVPDKVGFLARCAALSQALTEIGDALGLQVTAPVDVT